MELSSGHLAGHSPLSVPSELGSPHPPPWQTPPALLGAPAASEGDGEADTKWGAPGREREMPGAGEEWGTQSVGEREGERDRT